MALVDLPQYDLPVIDLDDRDVGGGLALSRTLRNADAVVLDAEAYGFVRPY